MLYTVSDKRGRFVTNLAKEDFEIIEAKKPQTITEFTADLIKHGKLKLDKSRNGHLNLTYHDSCNPARAMGIFEEPRYIIRNVCDRFHEMPPGTIREERMNAAMPMGRLTKKIHGHER